jgi:hypothetical protein
MICDSVDINGFKEEECDGIEVSKLAHWILNGLFSINSSMGFLIRIRFPPDNERLSFSSRAKV